jgi:long-chain acyl-CoA synthetase
MMPNTMPSSTTGTRYRSVGELLETYRKRDPAKIALVGVDRDKRITFGELAVAVDGIAVQLAQLGVRKGARVVLLAESSIEKIIVWLGIWRMGAVVCALDLTFVGPSASDTLRTIAPDLIISDGTQYGHPALRNLAALSVPVVRFSEWEPGVSGRRADEKNLVIRTDTAVGDASLLPSPAITDMASLTCTSGTTGTPKIVAYDHLAYWENGLDSVRLLDLQECDRTLEYRSLGWYSAQILSLMPFLQTGLTLHVARKFSYRHLPDWIERYGITVCIGVPTVINILLNKPVPDAAKRFASLRTITCSTAPLSTAHWIRFEEMYDVRLLNLYGSSETGWLCGNRRDACKIGTVGQPVDHVQLEILSDSGASCPPGTAGQLVIIADKLAIGYVRKDGTLEPIRGKPFKSSDVAMMDENGYVQILGRTDDLINRGGVKISPLEVEEVLLAHPHVLEAGVIGIPDPIYGQQILCYVVPQPGVRMEADSILAHCALRLPREKVPVQAIVIASLPRNPRGKLLRDTLLTIYQGKQPEAP